MLPSLLISSGLVGGGFAALASEALPTTNPFVQIIASGGVAVVCAYLLFQRLSKVEDERAQLLREAVAAISQSTSATKELVDAVKTLAAHQTETLAKVGVLYEAATRVQAVPPQPFTSGSPSTAQPPPITWPHIV